MGPVLAGVLGAGLACVVGGCAIAGVVWMWERLIAPRKW